jgi:hypothetical protein
MQPYPIPDNDPWKQEVTRLRDEDVQAFDGLVKLFVRKVSAPSSSSDVTGYSVGDFAYAAGYLYILVDDGTVKWQRVSLSDF